MKNKNIFFKLIFVLSLIMFTDCETFDLEQTVNPNDVNNKLLDPLYAFNYVQLLLPDFFDSANNFTQQVTRQVAMTGGKTYDNAFEPVNSNNNWTTGYLLLNAIKILQPKAISTKQFDVQAGSKIIKAYVLLTLVDLYGDVPYTEALLGNENLEPKFDKSSDVYKKAIIELDEAIAIIDNGASQRGEAYDLYYGTGKDKKFDKDKWKTLAKTLKFRALVTARKAGALLGLDIASELTSLMAGDLIDTSIEDFVFKYSTERDNPNSRHPFYNDGYDQGFSSSPSYLSNYFMWTMVREKPLNFSDSQTANLVDPRTKYYFYNQVGDANGSDTFSLPCKVTSRPEHYNFSQYASFYKSDRLSPFCTTRILPSSAATPYWGSDHGNSSGRPQDADKVTLVGLYPAGGKFGGGTAARSFGTTGEKGAGIAPILLSSFVRFLKAEVQYTVFNNPAAAKIEMDLGINASINKSTTLFAGYLQPTALEITKYLTYVDTFYDNNPSKQLETIMKEFYIASWGNGIEAYNNYRRTGFPSNMQPTLEPSSVSYFFTAYYPSASVASNPNAPENVRTKKTFWDINSPVLQ